MLVVVDTCWEAFVLSKHTRFPESVFENSLYCRLSISQSPIQCRGLPVDDVQKCDCWHHHFSLLFFLQSVSCEGFCQSPRYVRSLSNKPRCQGIEYWHFFVNYENKYLARTWLVSTLEAFLQWTAFYVTGTAGDSLSVHGGKPFTTRDQDNDNKPDKNCARWRHGAWWYNVCHRSNLNGIYRHQNPSPNGDGVNWYYWKGYTYSLKRTEMKIRPVDFSSS